MIDAQLDADGIYFNRGIELRVRANERDQSGQDMIHRVDFCALDRLGWTLPGRNVTRETRGMYINGNDERR
jgi:hypothetical protein